MKELIKVIVVILLGFLYSIGITFVFAYAGYTVWKYGMNTVFNYDLSFTTSLICSIFIIFFIDSISHQELKYDNNLDINKEYVNTILKMTTVFINRLIKILTSWLIAYLITTIFI